MSGDPVAGMFGLHTPGAPPSPEIVEAGQELARAVRELTKELRAVRHMLEDIQDDHRS
jgi:hypothetical protein